MLSPVRRLRPCRTAHALVENVPNPEILTVSPIASASPVAVKTAFKTVSASARDSEASEATRDERSAFFIPQLLRES